MPTRSRETALSRGHLRPGRGADPPAPPALVTPRLPHRITSAGMSIDDVVRGLLVSYKQAGDGEHMYRLTKYALTIWWGLLREIALRLIDEGISPAYYVAFVCAEIRRKQGHFPYPAQVFSTKSIGGWLPVYRKAWAIPTPTHRSSTEARRAHAEAVLARLRSH
jgi:hypothetical protein